VLCFGCVPPLLSFIAFIISSALNCQSSICTSIIMLRFIICTYTLFLSWTTSTYHIHSYPQSLWSLLSSLPLSLPQRPFFFARTCITYIITIHLSIIHAFPDNFILGTHTCFLEQLCITMYILRFGLVIQDLHSMDE